MSRPASPRSVEVQASAQDAAAIEADIAARTDAYFKKTKAAVLRQGDKRVTYAFFLRRPAICTQRLMMDWLDRVASARNTKFEVEPLFDEGDWVGAGEPLIYISGSFANLVDLETILLQKLGPACVAAYNAYSMCCDLPGVEFLAMDARHCAGGEMAELMAYAASVGSAAAKADVGAKGFIGNANDATAHFFGRDKGLGTMPHAFVGYAGSTLRAAQLYHDCFPDEPLSVLVDYYGREVSDALEVCRAFPDLAAAGQLAVRIDTHGGRYVEGLDPAASYAVLERHVPNAIRQYRTEAELKMMVGTGVSAAAIWHIRSALDEAGFGKVRIVATSGFSPAKCKVMASVRAPIDVIGTGSYLPELWTETYATADIIEYDGQLSVKAGREFLFRR